MLVIYFIQSLCYFSVLFSYHTFSLTFQYKYKTQNLHFPTSLFSFLLMVRILMLLVHHPQKSITQHLELCTPFHLCHLFMIYNPDTLFQMRSLGIKCKWSFPAKLSLLSYNCSQLFQYKLKAPNHLLTLFFLSQHFLFSD